MIIVNITLLYDPIRVSNFLLKLFLPVCEFLWCGAPQQYILDAKIRKSLTILGPRMANPQNLAQSGHLHPPLLSMM